MYVERFRERVGDDLQTFLLAFRKTRGGATEIHIHFALLSDVYICKKQQQKILSMPRLMRLVQFDNLTVIS